MRSWSTPGLCDTHRASGDRTCAAGALRASATRTGPAGTEHAQLGSCKKKPLERGLILFLFNLFNESGDSRNESGKCEDDLREVLDKFSAHR